MKALSLIQPWAWVMLEYTGPGPKDIENRKWSTEFRGDFLIHASRGYDVAGHGWIENELGITIPELDRIRRGGIVGMARLVDCVTEHPSRWFCGPYGFVLANRYPLPFLPCPGRLGFWEYGGLISDEALRLRVTNTNQERKDLP